MSERLLRILVTSFMQLLEAGLKMTMPITLGAFALSVILGLLLAVVQVANIKGLKQFASFYIWIFRGTPVIVQLFIIFFGLPYVGIVIEAVPAAIIGFGLNLAAYNAESIRAAILAVPKGQTEAAYLVGLTYPQLMRRIVIPQAARVAFPSLWNNLISLVKDTSLAASITVVELFTRAQQVAARTYEPLAMYLEAAFIYLIFCTVLTWIQHIVERKMVWQSHTDNKNKRRGLLCLK
ncbi:MAG: amino acid ABC transporter permease [Lachnospiraceae bacterium]|nr:amino acid ABC transporter permease [Lachnospiraceae bacterium]